MNRVFIYRAAAADCSVATDGGSVEITTFTTLAQPSPSLDPYPLMAGIEPKAGE